MKDIIVIGTGGHAKVISDIIELNGDNLLGFLTADKKLHNFLGKPVLGLDTDYEKFTDSYFIIAIGNQYVRRRFADTMKGVRWYTAIHPTAVISSLNVTIDEGTVVNANAVINPCAVIGKHCIVNTNASVEHDNIISDFSHISVGTKLGGNVTIGENTWVGMGATVRNGVRICNDCTIGCGAVVVKDVVEPGTYVGIPARKVENVRNWS